MRERLLFIELNEFNHRLLTEASTVYSLANIKKAVGLPCQRKTVTSDVYDSGYLEPWVQWVSVHTGSPSTEHKIKHLGDVRFNNKKQLWEELSDQGITTGIWGAMNATRGSAANCKFFLPDPWTFEEEAYPREINHFLALPRYMARNYLRPKAHILLGSLIRFAQFMCRGSTIRAFIAELPYFLRYVSRYKGANFVTYSFAEYLSTLRFLDYWKKDQPQFSSIFLNLVAHVQHYYWEDVPLEQNDRLKYVFTYLDKILGVIFDVVGDDTDILITNGLTQINTNKEPPWILYRQKDHGALLARLGLKPKSIQACMTHEAHLFFGSVEERINAEEILASCRVGEKKFFYLENYDAEPTKLFYMIEFTDPVDDMSQLTWSGGSFIVLEEFKPIVRRTAKHAGAGLALATANILPGLPFQNHELYDVILKYFDLSRANAQ